MVFWFSLGFLLFLLVTCNNTFELIEENIIDNSEFEINNDSYLAFRSIKSEFRLYTRNNRHIQFLAVDNTLLLSNSAFSFERVTWFYVHGWLGNGLEEKVISLKDSFLSSWDVNVIILDWSMVSKNKYRHARAGMIYVAEELALFINFLVDLGYPLKNVNLVGHSLGAHLIGITAKKCKERNGQMVASITGLDPASLYFNFNDFNSRLDMNDALYVEVVHTNAGVAGFMSPLGHVDFYVNGGIIQPECSRLQLLACPHLRAVSIYERAMKNKILGFKCTTLANALRGNCEESAGSMRLGGNLPKNWIAGIYWLATV